MKTRSHTVRRTLVRSVLAGMAVVVAIPTLAIAASPFTDVPPGQWFSDAVDWAYDNGITTGVSPTEFGGEQGFTRYQAVTMLERMDSKIIQPGLDAVEDDVSALGGDLAAAADDLSAVADDVSSLGNQVNAVADDISTMLHAVVNGDGGLEPNPSTNGVTSTRVSAGRYVVDFPIDVSSCAWQATLVIAHDGGLLLAQPDPIPGSVGLAPRFNGSLDSSAIFVETWDATGANADRDFTLSVICSPLTGYGLSIVFIPFP